MSNEKPILFSTEMIQAIRDGRKTQTRRIVKPKYAARAQYASEKFGTTWTADHDNCLIPAQYGLVGDLLWCRETWATLKVFDDLAPRDIPHGGARWPATYMKAWRGAAKHSEDRGKWRPSIFMPRWASETSLLVTRVRIERLQEITEDDAKAEGVEPYERPQNNAISTPWSVASHRTTFVQLWDQINADRGYAWQSNPMVWVIDFKVIVERERLYGSAFAREQLVVESGGEL